MQNATIFALYIQIYSIQIDVYFICEITVEYKLKLWYFISAQV